MHVRIDESGEDGFSTQIDHPCVLSPSTQDILILTNSKDAISFNGYGFLNGELLIDRDNLAVVQDEVSLLGEAGRVYG
jgi:hypothetical protein